MINIYKCSYCGQIFENDITGFYECKEHEAKHLEDRYFDLKKSCKNICEHCKNVYYVYNIRQCCEYSKDCNKSNFWKYFELKETKTHE